MDVASVHARTDLRGKARAPPGTRRAGRISSETRAEREGARDVGVARRLGVKSGTGRGHHVVAGDRPRAGVVADRRLRAVGDNHLLGEGAVGEEHRLDSSLQELAVSGSPSTASPSPDGVARGQLARGRDTGLNPLRSADPRELVGVLAAAAVVEETLVDDELDTTRPQCVRDPDGEAAGTNRQLDPRPRAMRRASSSSYSWVGRPLRLSSSDPNSSSAARPARDRGPRPASPPSS